MAIDLANLANPAATTTPTVVGKKTPAQIWLNIGTEMPIEVSPGVTEMRFISLPFGIGLDNMEPSKVSGSNKVLAEMQNAKNHLLKLLLTKAATFKPGENGPVKLQIQMQKVNSVADQSTTVDITAFLNSLDL